MTSERGEYRSIRRVLLDGPDFQKLPERARWLFVALKLTAGPTGIDVWYLDAMTPQLSAQTGIPRPAIPKALDTLEAAGWIRREANLLWIVGHLEHDPHMKPNDAKHRKAVQRHVASLPRLALVREFVQAQLAWFPASEGPSCHLGWAIEGPKKGHRSTDNETEDETRTRKKRLVAGADAPRPSGESWLLPSSRVWEGRFGAGTFPWGEFGKACKSLKQHHEPAKIADHLKRFLDVTPPEFAIPAKFAKTFGEWAPIDTGAMVDEFGCMTEVGDRETRPLRKAS